MWFKKEMKVILRKGKCDIEKKGNKKLYYLIIFSFFLENKIRIVFIIEE